MNQMSAGTLRLWRRHREVDAGQRPGVPTDVAAENARLRRETQGTASGLIVVAVLVPLVIALTVVGALYLLLPA